MVPENLRPLANRLFDVGSVQFVEFKLVSGIVSPIYFNFRTKDHPTKPGPLRGEDVTLIAQSFIRLAEEAELEYDGVVGVPEAGKPLSRSFWTLSEARGRVLSEVVLSKGSDGRISRVEWGMYSQGDTFILLDDVITKADSKLEAIKLLVPTESEYLFVKDILVIVDREQGGKALLIQEGYNLHCLFTMTDLLQYYLQIGRITQKQFDRVITYLANN